MGSVFSFVSSDVRSKIDILYALRAKDAEEQEHFNTFRTMLDYEKEAQATEDYEVLFEDSSYTNGYAEPLPVAQRYVIAYRPTKKGAGSGSGNLSSA